MSTVFSGIRPSGKLHIGNYLGAIKQWVELQKEHDCIYSIVDLHAITTPYEPDNFQETIKETAAAYLASGIDPEESIFFVQSEVKEHLELAWFLNCICPVGELERMTQYKDKSKSVKGSPKAGLLNYPVLMAADILVYKANLVPIGEDQQQHLELARDLARRFNNKFGETFEEPESYIPKVGARIMSLSNPENKMSKSGSEKGCIGLFDTEDEIRDKIMSAVTDSGKDIKYDPKKKAGVSNLLTIYSLFSDKEIKDLEKEFKNKNYGDFKKELADLIVEELNPFREKKKELLSKENYIDEILDVGAQKASKKASETIKEVKEKMGFIR